MAPSATLRARNRGKAAQRQDDPTFERAKNIATIVSAIAIPIVLAIVGYFVQRELSNEGLKKDYVGIAAGILKEYLEGGFREARAGAENLGCEGPR
ncbi:MAG: hypothetical protein LT106_04790 [Burkholderiaceae bacterium]|nr:hypothetical protein [Burkholderiaceae bacterium]